MSASQFGGIQGAGGARMNWMPFALQLIAPCVAVAVSYVHITADIAVLKERGVQQAMRVEHLEKAIEKVRDELQRAVMPSRLRGSL